MHIYRLSVVKRGVISEIYNAPILGDIPMGEVVMCSQFILPNLYSPLKLSILWLVPLYLI